MLLLLDSQCVDVDNCGIDIPHVYDFGFFVPVLMENGVGTNEYENANPHGERAKHFHFIRMQMLLKEADHHATLVPNDLSLVG